MSVPEPAEPTGVMGDSETRIVDGYDCLLLDLDGVLYRGGAAIEGAADAMRGVRDSGARVAFVTNNASRTPERVAGQLVSLGIDAAASDVVTSAQAAAREMARLVEPGAPVLVVGGDGLWEAVTERGLRPVRSRAESPVGVVQGFDPGLGWRQLAEASYVLADSVPWVVSNLDATVPTADGIAPGNGTLVRAVATATGREPDVVAGKPHRPLFDETLRRMGGRRPLFVGDRIDTDIDGARACDADSLLVLSGVSDLRAVCECPPQSRPTYVGPSIAALLAAHPRPRLDGACRQQDGWRVEVADAKLRVVEQGGDAAAGLRTMVAAAWDWLDRSADREPSGRESTAGNGHRDRPPLDVADAATALEAARRRDTVTR